MKTPSNSDVSVPMQYTQHAVGVKGHTITVIVCFPVSDLQVVRSTGRELWDWMRWQRHEAVSQVTSDEMTRSRSI